VPGCPARICIALYYSWYTVFEQIKYDMMNMMLEMHQLIPASKTYTVVHYAVIVTESSSHWLVLEVLCCHRGSSHVIGNTKGYHMTAQS